LLVDGGRSCDDVRLLRQTVHKRTPVLDAIIFHAQQVDMGRRPEQPVLQFLPESIVDGEGDHKGGDPSGDSGNRNTGDDPNKSLAAFCAQIAGSNEKLKAHKKTSGVGFSAKLDYNDDEVTLWKILWSELPRHRNEMIL
jgi:hypothetical protein